MPWLSRVGKGTQEIYQLLILTFNQSSGSSFQLLRTLPEVPGVPHSHTFLGFRSTNEFSCHWIFHLEPLHFQISLPAKLMTTTLPPACGLSSTVCLLSCSLLPSGFASFMFFTDSLVGLKMEYKSIYISNWPC